MSNCVHVGEVELLVKPREGFPDLMSGKRETVAWRYDEKLGGFYKKR